MARNQPLNHPLQRTCKLVDDLSWVTIDDIRLLLVVFEEHSTDHMEGQQCLGGMKHAATSAR